MFIDDAKLKSSLASVLKIASPNDLPLFYDDDIIARSNTAAYQDIVGKLIARGYRKVEEIDLWDRGEEFQRALGVFWCLVNSGAYGNMDAEAMKMLDRRKELESVIVTVDDLWVKPVGDNPGLVVSSGPMTGGDVFVYPDPDDPYLGRPTRF